MFPLISFIFLLLILTEYISSFEYKKPAIGVIHFQHILIEVN